MLRQHYLLPENQNHLTQLIQPYYGKREPVPASGYVSGQGCYGSIAGAFVGSVMRWFSGFRGRETALAHAPATGYVATPAIGAEMGLQWLIQPLGVLPLMVVMGFSRDIERTLLHLNRLE